MLLLLLILIQTNMYDNLHESFKNNKMKDDFSTNDIVTIVMKSLTTNNVENSNEKSAQQKQNKTEHSKNGNKNKKANKFIKVMLFNKGSSNVFKYIEVIKHLIEEEDPIVCILTESNVKKTDKIDDQFKDYEILNKFEDDTSS